MSNLVEELRERGLHVPDVNRPLGEVEPGRIEAIRTGLLPGVGQAEVANGAGIKSTETVKNWSDDPSSLTKDKAERLIAALASLFAEQYGIGEDVARKIVLDEFTKDANMRAAEEAYRQGMHCILSNVADYLLSKEMESLCDAAVEKVLNKRHSQASQSDLAAFLEVAETWERLYEARGNKSSARAIDAGRALQEAVAAFHDAEAKRPVLVAEDGQSA